MAVKINDSDSYAELPDEVYPIAGDLRIHERFGVYVSDGKEGRLIRSLKKDSNHQIQYFRFVGQNVSKDMVIYVNGRQVVHNGIYITRKDVLSYVPNHKFDDEKQYTITYRGPHTSGHLEKKIICEPGLIFNAYNTSNA